MIIIVINHWSYLLAEDRFGRDIHYLRISLTDHCNLRCVYCMPEDMTFRPNADLMQNDEIILFVNLFSQLGFDKYRLTGGEPTVRANVVNLVHDIASQEGVKVFINDHQWCAAEKTGTTIKRSRIAAS